MATLTSAHSVAIHDRLNDAVGVDSSAGGDLAAPGSGELPGDASVPGSQPLRSMRRMLPAFIDAPAMPACYLYVLPLLGEDIAKLGISVDPLARVRAFSRRYYECFDLERSSLVGFDSVAEARRAETALHRQLRAWNAPRPLTVPLRAGGHTEWYRGAYGLLQEECGRARERGHPVHQPAGDWWRQRLLQEQTLLFEWGEACLHDLSEDALPQSDLWPGIVDVLDAWPAVGLRVDDALPEALARAYRTYRSAWGASLRVPD